MKKIALGVSSSVGIYKACEVVRGFQKNGVEVQVVMTPNAAHLAAPFQQPVGKDGHRRPL
jgi:phosphopantothenoylcysteine decarboxylase/phosphopantothenate--cysteine ligase